MAYCTPDEVLRQRRADNDDSTARDPSLAASCIADAEAWIDDFCGRSFDMHKQAVKQYRPKDGGQRRIRIGDAVAVTTVATRRSHRDEFVDLDDTAWQLEDPGVDGWPAEELWLLPGEGYWPCAPPPVATVRVNGTLGWPAVPEPIHRACILKANFFISQYANAGLSGDEIVEQSPDFGVVTEVRRLIGPYRKFHR